MRNPTYHSSFADFSASEYRAHISRPHPVLKHISADNFGLLIAYFLPGLVALWGLRPFAPVLDQILGSPAGGPTVGAFLHTSVAAIGAGMTVSTLRWLAIDTLHHATGLKPPPWDFGRLVESPAAFSLIVEHYYRYYQFHANSLVSLMVVFTVRRWSLGLTGPIGWTDAGLVALMAVFWAGSRNSLQRYYARGGALLESRRGTRSRQNVSRATSARRADTV